MSKDFRASQIETSKIIASGAIAAGKPLGIAIYSGSIASNRSGGVTDSAIFSNVGTDVFLFVSGTTSNANFNRSNVTLFGGDVVVSGTIYAERQVIEVDGVVDGDMIITGSLRVEPDADGVDSVVFRNAAGSLDLFSVNTSAQASVVVNESSGDVDFRVESNDETHMLFVEASTNRVSIGDSVDSPAATLEVTNNDAAGAFDVPLVQLNSNDVNQIALDINAANTTANIIDVSASALTSGIPLFIDHNDSATTAVTPKSIHIDFDKSGVAGNSVTQDFVATHIEMNDAATNDAGSTVRMTAVEIDVDSANAQGTTHNTGINITVTDAATNDGIRIKAEDGAGSDIKMMSTANNNDFTTVAVGANGETTITTVDADNSLANLNFVVDGATDIQSTGNVTIDSSAGTIGVGTDNVNQNINVGTQGTRTVTVGAVPANGATTTTINSRGGTLTLEGTGQTVDINSAALDIDATGAVTIDGASVTINDGSADSDFRVETNNLQGAILLDAGTDAVILRSNATTLAGHAAAAKGTDVAILLSGTVGTKGTATRGVSLLAGDVHLSGAFSFSELATAPSAGGDEAVLYAKDDSGVTKLFMKQSNGVEVGPLGSGGSLNDAYDTPNGGGTKSAGIGGVISVDGQPVQIAVAAPKTFALAVTGSSAFGNVSSEFSNHLPPIPGTDSHFFVSGTIGGTGITGTSIFGGDVVVSGALGVNTVTVTTDGKIGIGTNNPSYKLEVGGNASFGEKLIHRGDDDTFIQFAEDSIGFTAGGVQLITLSEPDPGQDIVKIGDGTDVDFQVRTLNDNNTLYVHGETDRVGIGINAPVSILHVKESAPTISIQRENNSNDSTIAFLGAAGFTGAIMHLSTSNDLVFKTHDGSSPQEILRLGGHYAEDVRQIIMLSGSDMHAGAMQPKEATDINFFASGSMMSRGTTTRGTAVFGGDLVVSGGMYAGRIASVEDDTSFIDLAENTIELNANHSVSIHDPLPAEFKDTNFFVSGSIGSSGNPSERGTSVFGGDVVISGSLRTKRALLKHHLIWAGSVSGVTPRFAASLNGGGGANANPDIEHFWSVAGSGSLKAMDLWVSEPSGARVGIGLFVNSDTVPALHCTGTFANNDIIGDGNRGHLFVDFGLTQFMTGSNSFNPGDLISITLAELGGGAFSKIRGTLYYEMDETNLHSNQSGGTLG